MEIVSIANESHLRLMRPLITEESCLKCHAAQGYEVGDIRGGVSISVPMEKLLAEAHSDIWQQSIAIALIWLLGICGLGFGGWRNQMHVVERDKAEDELRVSRQRFQTLAEHASTYVYEASVDAKGDTHLEWASARFIDMYGCTVEEYKKLGDWQAHEHPDDLSASLERLQQVLSGEALIAEKRIVRSDGEIRNVVLASGHRGYSAQRSTLYRDDEAIHRGLSSPLERRHRHPV